MSFDPLERTERDRFLEAARMILGEDAERWRMAGFSDRRTLDEGGDEGDRRTLQIELEEALLEEEAPELLNIGQRCAVGFALSLAQQQHPELGELFGDVSGALGVGRLVAEYIEGDTEDAVRGLRALGVMEAGTAGLEGEVAP